MSYIDTLVQLQIPSGTTRSTYDYVHSSRWTGLDLDSSGNFSYVGLKQPTTISANRGLGVVTGDTEITWETKYPLGSQAYASEDFLPDNSDRAIIYVFASRNNSINRFDESYLINAYHVESVDINKEDSGFSTRLRGRDAMQAIMNTSVSGKFSGDNEITIGNETNPPTASMIIRKLIADHFSGTSDGGIYVDDSGVATKNRRNISGVIEEVDFPTIDNYTFDNKSFADVLLDLSRGRYTSGVQYTFNIKPRLDGSAYLSWQPLRTYDVIWASNTITNGGSITIDATNTRIAQNFYTPSGGKKIQARGITYYMQPGGTLQGYWTIEDDSGGSPDGSTIAQTDTITLTPSTKSKILFQEPKLLAPGYSGYWLVFYRTGGSGKFYCTSSDIEDTDDDLIYYKVSQSSSDVKYYSGTWATDPYSIDIYHQIHGLPPSISVTEKYFGSHRIFGISANKNFYDMVNMVILKCGEDASGVPILVDYVSPSSSMAHGLKTVKRTIYLARSWKKENKEKKYPFDVSVYDSSSTVITSDTGEIGHSGTVYRTITVNNFTEYNNALRDTVKAIGRDKAREILHEVSKGPRGGWDIEVNMAGTNEFYIGQTINADFNNIDIGSQISKGTFYISGVTNNIDSNGWTTNIRLTQKRVS